MNSSRPPPPASNRSPLPDIPEALAAVSRIIASAPATFEWSSPYAARYGGVGLASKLPMRLHVGLEDLPEGSPCVGTILYHRPESGDHARLSGWEPQRLSGRIARALERHAGGRFHRPVRIHVWSEFPAFRGLQLDAALATALAVALHVAFAGLTSERLDHVMGLPSAELWRDADFLSLFRLAWCIECAVCEYRPEGHFTFALLTRSPLVVFCRQSEAFHDPPTLDEDPIELLKPGGARFTELPHARAAAPHGASGPFAPPPLPAVPDPTELLDAALLFFGSEGDSRLAFQEHRNVFRDKVNDAYAAAALLRDLVPAGASPRFAEIADSAARSGGKGTVADVVLDMVVVDSVRTLDTLRRLARGPDPDVLSELRRSVRRSHDVFRFLGLSSKAVDDGCRAVSTAAATIRDLRVAVRLVGPGRAGCLLVVSRGHTLARHLPALLSALGPGAHAHWTSWEQGYSEEGWGARVVQAAPPVEPPRPPGKRRLCLYAWRGGRAEPAREIEFDEWKRVRGEFSVVFDGSDGVQLLVDGNAQRVDGPARRKWIMLVRALLERAEPGATSVELGGKAVHERLGMNTYTISHLKRNYLRPLGEEVLERCQLEVIQQEGFRRSDPEDQRFKVVFTPQPRHAVAAVWPAGPGAASWP